MKTIISNKMFTVGFLCASLLVSNLQAKDTTKDALYEAEKIRTISQDIAKNYFYIEQGIQASSAKIGFKNDMLSLNDILGKLKKNSTP